MADNGTQFQTEATMGRQQGIAGHLRSHRTVTQDKVGQDETALHVVHWTRQMVRPPSRTRT